MAETLLRLNAEIVSVSRSQGTDALYARVCLRFRFGDHSEATAGQLATTVSLTEKDGFHWRQTRRQIVAAAWDWLDAYFDGARFGADDDNLFAEMLGGDPKRNASGLTPEEEKHLQRELRKIERECAA